MIPGAVADGNGAGVPPAAQVRQRSFGQDSLAADAVHDLHGVVGVIVATGGLGQEGEKIRRLFGAGADVEGFERQAGVAEPRVAVVPVALAADLLWQRRRRGCDDRPCRSVSKSLKDSRAQADIRSPLSTIDVVGFLPRP